MARHRVVYVLTDDVTVVDRLALSDRELAFAWCPTREVNEQLKEDRAAGWVIDVESARRVASAVINTLRGRWPQVPILVVGARTADDLAEYMERGADDVLTNDFDDSSTRVRLKRFLQRPVSLPHQQVLEVGDLTLDRIDQLAWLDGKPVKMTRRELRILECLALNFGHAVSKGQLLEYMWVYRGPRRASANTAEVVVGALRRKLRASNELSIATVRHHGYQLVRTSKVLASP